MSVADIVIIAFEFYELVCKLLHAVKIEVIAHYTVQSLIGSIRFSNTVIFYYHLAICVKRIVACFKAGSCQCLVQIQGNILCQLVCIADVIISAFKRNKLVAILSDTIKIEIIAIRSAV